MNLLHDHFDVARVGVRGKDDKWSLSGMVNRFSLWVNEFVVVLSPSFVDETEAQEQRHELPKVIRWIVRHPIEECTGVLLGGITFVWDRALFPNLSLFC